MISQPFVPAPRETLFLRACLHEGTGARDAWTGWLEAATKDGTPARRALVPVNALLPLLAWNLSRNGAAIDQHLQTHLRSARLTEELRWEQYRAICDSAFRVLQEGDVPFIALKGAVIGQLVYPVPLFRHADDIDVLLRADAIRRAEALLVDAGWRRHDPPVLRNPLHPPPLVHPDGVTIELHRRIAIPYYTIPYDSLWERSQWLQIDGLSVRVLSDSDSLLHACAHGMSGAPEIKWAVDAWFILARSRSFDWSTFTATAAAARLDLPLYHALRYMSEQLGAVVPAQVLEQLGAGGARAGFLERQAARQWFVATGEEATNGSRGRLRSVGTAWRSVFPPPVQFALHYDVRLWTVPFYYFYRLARYLRLKQQAGGERKGV